MIRAELLLVNVLANDLRTVSMCRVRSGNIITRELNPYFFLQLHSPNQSFWNLVNRLPWNFNYFVFK